MTEIDTSVHLAYGFIDDIKLSPGNWSVKVVVYPQPSIYANADQPLRYGGQVEPNEDNPDGWGEWITLGEPPWVIAMHHGDTLRGQFVEIRYIGAKPWEGQAFVVNQSDTEDPDTLDANERGVMRILSAIAPLI